MHDSKLVTVLQLLNKKETERLRKFVRSPFFNEEPAVERLLEFVLQFFPKYTHRHLTKEAAMRQVYAQQAYAGTDPRHIDKLMLTLLGLVEQFMATLQSRGRSIVPLAVVAPILQHPPGDGYAAGGKTVCRGWSIHRPTTRKVAERRAILLPAI